MRKRVCALMITLVLLAGCSGEGAMKERSADELALAIRTEYLSMTACNATVEITADYGQRIFEYTLSVFWAKDGETVLTVIAPEKIAGITAHIEKGKTRLEYDGVSIETGPVTAEGLSPMEAVPAVLDYILTGSIAECAVEQGADGGELVWFLCRQPNTAPGTGVEGEFWFDGDTHAPVKAQLSQDGYTVITCLFTDFTKE